MLFNVAIFGSLLLVPAVLAVPSGIGTSVARRCAGHQSQINNRLEQATDVVTNTQYSGNWAGAIWDEVNGTFIGTSITGTFTVPSPSGSVGSSAAAWVGIDGNTCTSAIIQTGISFTVESGKPSYTAWYEWYPAPSYTFTNISISAGDDIKLTVTASTNTSGTVTIENMTNGQKVSEGLTYNSFPLCGQNAEWIVEDYMDNGSLVPFANFGTVVFTGATAGTYTASGAVIFDIEQNNQVLTSVTTSGSSVTINYV